MLSTNPFNQSFNQPNRCNSRITLELRSSLSPAYDYIVEIFCELSSLNINLLCCPLIEGFIPFNHLNTYVFNPSW